MLRISDAFDVAIGLEPPQNVGHAASGALSEIG